MAKTEVYSWRLSPRLKSQLEEAAHDKQKSLAELLEQIVEDWLCRGRRQQGDDEEQQRLHAAALKFVGTIDGGRPDRAENARADVRSRLARRHGR
ncbi:MAG TPA: hypothetical protein VOA87_22345 [Thermoanaerobaculia bacterium]|nr:hypothetical protein [Thermoanaerobaculia bacterium]